MTTEQPIIRRTKKKSIKGEVSSVVTTALSESKKSIEFGLKGTANVLELVYNETSVLAHESRVNVLTEKLEASIEAIQALEEYGHSQEDINAEIKVLKQDHIKRVLELSK